MPTINSCEAERNKSTDCTQINATFTWEADSASSKGNNWTLLLMYEVKNAPKSSLCDLDKQDKWDSFDYWLKGMKLEYYTIGNLFPHAVDRKSNFIIVAFSNFWIEWSLRLNIFAT